MGLMAATVYVLFALAIGYSAIRHRRKGWGWGVLLAVLLLAIPGIPVIAFAISAYL